jgi:hypothetical protein
MHSNNTRIAYLKRMLTRLKDENARLSELVSSGQLTQDGADLGAQQLGKHREALVSELLSLEGEVPQAGETSLGFQDSQRK